MQELNATVKLLMETNTTLQQENTDLKAKLEKTSNA
jgi:regulator of replication initiation timing